MNDFDKIELIVRHIRNVQDNCLILGKKLIETGFPIEGRHLIANGFIHDNSKFTATEFDLLDHYKGMKLNKEKKMKLELAISQHNRTNPHHPEYWGSIHMMPEIYIAELVCDWKSRAEEFGTALMDWVDGGAMKRFGFDKNDPIYKRITYYADLLCDKPFNNNKE